ncbi:hypothetical protein GCM10027416_12330 [Okibacterium endophyticum]
MSATRDVIIDAEAFAEAAGHLASGVTILTTALGGRTYGTTASAVLALSNDPPMMLACLNRSSSTHDAIIRAGIFAINILGEDQGGLARRFGSKVDDKFAGVEYRISSSGGVPMLGGALATLVCRVEEHPSGGTHSVFFGTVLSAETTRGHPLAYFRGTFGRLERLREREAYDSVRRLVLERSVAPGDDLDVEDLAVRLDVRPDDVHNALVRLSTESLVERDERGAFTPSPITVELSDSLYDARANIEIGVVANHIERVPKSTLRHLTAIVARMGELRASSTADSADFLSLHSEYHAALVALSGSSQLEEWYQRLSIARVWRSVWSELEWRALLDCHWLTELTRALEAVDVDEAIACVRAYNDQAKLLARVAIEQRGGAV